MIAVVAVEKVENPHPRLFVGDISGIFLPRPGTVDVVFDRLFVEFGVGAFQLVDLFAIAREPDRIEAAQRVFEREIVVRPRQIIDQHITLRPRQRFAGGVFHPYIVIGGLRVEFPAHRTERDVERINRTGCRSEEQGRGFRRTVGEIAFHLAFADIQRSITQPVRGVVQRAPGLGLPGQKVSLQKRFGGYRGPVPPANAVETTG